MRGPSDGGLKAEVFQGSQVNLAGDRLPSWFLAGEQASGSCLWVGVDGRGRSLEKIEAGRCGLRPDITPGQMDEEFSRGSQGMNGREQEEEKLEFPSKACRPDAYMHTRQEEEGKGERI